MKIAPHRTAIHPTKLIRAQVCLILLALALILTGCTSATALPTYAPTATQVVAKTQIPSPLPSSTAVHTLQPTSLATETTAVEQTLRPEPTSTPLVPTPYKGQAYRLTAWTPDKAEQLIQYFKKYPDNFEALASLTTAYAESFRYEGLIELESLLRFPQSAQRKTWQWDGAYNMYQSSNKDIASLYADLVAHALNQKEINLQDLNTSFAKAARFRIDTYPITPPKGYQKSMVLHFYEWEYGEGISYGFAIWLVQKEGTFVGYPLPNGGSPGLGNKYSEVGTADINGDEIAEAIVQTLEEQSFGQHSGTMRIYRLDQAPPQEVSLDTPLPDPGSNEWSVDPSQASPAITFKFPISTFSDLPCNTFIVGWQYQWQDKKLKLIQVIPPSVEAMEQDHPWCTRFLISELSDPEYLKNQAVLETYKKLLDLPFVEKDIVSFERPFGVEMQRFNLALFLSDQGDEAGASEQMQQISESTDPYLAEWRKDAAAFFTVRHNPQALLQFCLSSKECETFLNQSKIIELIPPSRFSEANMLLKQMGLNVQAAGSYDFDQDGQMEKWLILLSPYPCGSGTGFWIVAKGNKGIKGRQASGLCLAKNGEISTDVNIKPLESSGSLPVYQVSVEGEQRSSNPFLYWPINQEDPTVDSDQAAQMIDDIQIKLLLGQISPSEAQIQIKAIQKLPLQSGYGMPDLKAQMRYLLGLAQELNGENDQAAQTYLELWQDSPYSPYAVMAKAKLEPIQ